MLRRRAVGAASLLERRPAPDWKPEGSIGMVGRFPGLTDTLALDLPLSFPSLSLSVYFIASISIYLFTLACQISKINIDVSHKYKIPLLVENLNPTCLILTKTIFRFIFDSNSY